MHKGETFSLINVFSCIFIYLDEIIVGLNNEKIICKVFEPANLLSSRKKVEQLLVLMDVVAEGCKELILFGVEQILPGIFGKIHSLG